MESCEVLIVGGGPAGSSCARRLCDAGIDAMILDKAMFPRDKVCGGWITPQVLEALARIAPVTAVRGNNDTGSWADALPGETALAIAGVRIHVVHDIADLSVDVAKRRAA